MEYFKNASWMLSEYGLKFISAIFVSIYVARYLGPEQFGLLSYALAIVAIFMAVGRLGMDSILVRDIARYPNKSSEYMSTAFGLMLVMAIVGGIILSGLVYLLESDAETKVYIWIIATGLLFQVFLVVDYAFQAQVKAKYASIAKSLALGVSSFVKIYLVWVSAELQVFAIAYAFDHLIIAIMLVSMHMIRKQQSFLFGFDRELIKPLLKSAWPMILSAAAAILYMKIDQIFIKNIIGDFELGLYSAGVKLFEGWTTILFIITISLLPVLVKAYDVSESVFNDTFVKISSLMFALNLFIIFLIGLWGEQIILLLFGDLFVEAGKILLVLFLASIFTGFGFLSSRYFMVKNKEVDILKRTVLGLLINVPLNLMLIPKYGIVGAAYATFISLFIANYAIDFFLDKDLFLFKTRSLNLLNGLKL